MSPAPDPSDPGPAPRPGQALVLPTTLLGPLVIPTGTARAAEVEALAARVALYATRARGDGTRRAYRAAWVGFCQWCAELGREPLAGDPDTIAMYLVRRADDGCAVSTLRVGLAAIRTAHLLAGVPLYLRHAALSMVLEGITRSNGLRPRRQATPAVPELLRRQLATRPPPDRPLGVRRSGTRRAHARRSCPRARARGAAWAVSRGRPIVVVGKGCAFNSHPFIGDGGSAPNHQAGAPRENAPVRRWAYVWCPRAKPQPA
jgi:hypothetical protein